LQGFSSHELLRGDFRVQPMSWGGRWSLASDKNSDAVNSIARTAAQGVTRGPLSAVLNYRICEQKSGAVQALPTIDAKFTFAFQ
jgi:hypothetical protein